MSSNTVQPVDSYMPIIQLVNLKKIIEPLERLDLVGGAVRKDGAMNLEAERLQKLHPQMAHMCRLAEEKLREMAIFNSDWTRLAQELTEYLLAVLPLLIGCFKILSEIRIYDPEQDRDEVLDLQRAINKVYGRFMSTRLPRFEHLIELLRLRYEGTYEAERRKVEAGNSSAAEELGVFLHGKPLPHLE